MWIQNPHIYFIHGRQSENSLDWRRRRQERTGHGTLRHIATLGDSVLLPIPSEDSNGDGRVLTIGGWKTQKGLMEMIVTGKYSWEGRGVFMGIGDIMCGAYASEPPVWFWDVGGDPPHGSKLGGVSPPCGLVPHGGAPTTPHGQGLVYPPPPPPHPLEDSMR